MTRPFGCQLMSRAVIAVLVLSSSAIGLTLIDTATPTTVLTETVSTTALLTAEVTTPLPTVDPSCYSIASKEDYDLFVSPASQIPGVYVYNTGQNVTLTCQHVTKKDTGFLFIHSCRDCGNGWQFSGAERSRADLTLRGEDVQTAFGSNGCQFSCYTYKSTCASPPRPDVFKPAPMSCFFSRTSGIFRTVVFKKLPQPVSFQCQSYNWLTLDCTWTLTKGDLPVPDDNHCFLNFTYTCHEEVATLDKNCTNGLVTHLNVSQTVEDGGDNFVVRFHSGNSHFSMDQRYNFAYVINNKYGHVVANYSVTTNAVIAIFEAVEKLTVEGMGSNSSVLRVSWEFPPPAQGLVNLQNLVCSLRLVTTNVSWLPFNKSIPVSTEECNRGDVIVTGLHADVTYQAEVRFRANDSRYWSDQQLASGSTSMDVPAEPPKVTPGGYVIASCGTKKCLTVYHKAIPPKSLNGILTAYNLTIHPEQQGSTDPGWSVKKTFPTSPCSRTLTLPYEGRTPARACVSAETPVGSSSSMCIPVPAIHHSRVPSAPQEVTVEHMTNDSTYVIQWSADTSNTVIADQQTVFWCLGSMTHFTVQCQDQLHWAEAGANATSFVVNAGKMATGCRGVKWYFGVSRLSASVSAGISWSECTFKQGGRVWIPYGLQADPGESQMTLTWQVKCDNSFFYARPVSYLLYYRELTTAATSNQSQCLGGITQNVTARAGSTSVQHVLTKLTRDANYSVCVRAVTESGESHLTSPLVVSLKEKLRTAAGQDDNFEATTMIVVISSIFGFLLLLLFGWVCRRKWKKNISKLQATVFVIDDPPVFVVDDPAASQSTTAAPELPCRPPPHSTSTSPRAQNHSPAQPTTITEQGTKDNCPLSTLSLVDSGYQTTQEDESWRKTSRASDEPETPTSPRPVTDCALRIADSQGAGQTPPETGKVSNEPLSVDTLGGATPPTPGEREVLNLSSQLPRTDNDNSKALELASASHHGTHGAAVASAAPPSNSVIVMGKPVPNHNLAGKPETCSILLQGEVPSQGDPVVRFHVQAESTERGGGQMTTDYVPPASVLLAAPVGQAHCDGGGTNPDYYHIIGTGLSSCSGGGSSPGVPSSDCQGTNPGLPSERQVNTAGLSSDRQVNNAGLPSDHQVNNAGLSSDRQGTNSGLPSSADSRGTCPSLPSSVGGGTRSDLFSSSSLGRNLGQPSSDHHGTDLGLPSSAGGRETSHDRPSSGSGLGTNHSLPSDHLGSNLGLPLSSNGGTHPGLPSAGSGCNPCLLSSAGGANNSGYCQITDEGLPFSAGSEETSLGQGINSGQRINPGLPSEHRRISPCLLSSVGGGASSDLSLSSCQETHSCLLPDSQGTTSGLASSDEETHPGLPSASPGMNPGLDFSGGANNSGYCQITDAGLPSPAGGGGTNPGQGINSGQGISLGLPSPAGGGETNPGVSSDHQGTNPGQFYDHQGSTPSLSSSAGGGTSSDLLPSTCHPGLPSAGGGTDICLPSSLGGEIYPSLPSASQGFNPDSPSSAGGGSNLDYCHITDAGVPSSVHHAPPHAIDGGTIMLQMSDQIPRLPETSLYFHNVSDYGSGGTSSGSCSAVTPPAVDDVLHRLDSGIHMSPVPGQSEIIDDPLGAECRESTSSGCHHAAVTTPQTLPKGEGNESTMSAPYVQVAALTPMSAPDRPGAGYVYEGSVKSPATPHAPHPSAEISKPQAMSKGGYVTNPPVCPPSDSVLPVRPGPGQHMPSSASGNLSADFGLFQTSPPIEMKQIPSPDKEEEEVSSLDLPTPKTFLKERMAEAEFPPGVTASLVSALSTECLADKQTGYLSHSTMHTAAY